MSQIDSVEALEQSALAGGEPPAGLSMPLQALWLAKADRWDEAHEIAQNLGHATGSWIHGLLHLIEGDVGNSAYWYSRAGQPQPRPGQIDEEWRRIAATLLPKP